MPVDAAPPEPTDPSGPMTTVLTRTEPTEPDNVIITAGGHHWRRLGPNRWSHDGGVTDHWWTTVLWCRPIAITTRANEVADGRYEVLAGLTQPVTVSEDSPGRVIAQLDAVLATRERRAAMRRLLDDAEERGR